ncbi:MAG: serine hydrolase domain-containing protein [Cyclobacteriaceae bacterium]
MKKAATVVIIIYTSTQLLVAQKHQLPNQSNTFQEQLDHFIRTIRDEFDIKSGTSIGIVRNGKEIFLQSYGLRDKDHNLPVEIETPFYIASTTKSFVAMLAKILESKGVLDLSSPISAYVPELGINHDDNITINDLLSHQSGIQNSFVGIRTAVTGQQNYMTLVSLFKKYSVSSVKEYNYDNVGYILVGIIIQKVTGKSWQEHLKTEIFDPFEMTNTSAYVSYFDNHNIAKGHVRTKEGTKGLSYFKNDKTMHAAGGMLSTAQDVIKWLSMITNNGVHKGNQFLKTKHISELLLPHVYYDSSRALSIYEDYAYGLGWFISKRGDDELVNHEGGYYGFRTTISLWEENTIGIAVLANEGSLFSARVNKLIADYAYDLLSGKDSISTQKRTESLKVEIQKRVDKANQIESNIVDNLKTSKYKLRNNPLTMDIGSCQGVYSSSRLGDVQVKQEGDKLFISLGAVSGSVPIDTAKKGHFLVDFEIFVGEVKFYYNKNRVSFMMFNAPGNFNWKFKKIRQ